MGIKTKVDWCDSTWNPVTGCLHDCEYCYARKIAERFGGCWRLDLPPDTSWRGNVGERKLMGDYARHNDGKCHVLDEPEIECAVFDPPSGYRGKVKPYPYYFSPTFHRYKLDEPQKWKKPRTIFVCSMADLFGEWVPDEWIEQVFAACDAAPWHRYIFLTKNPKRLCRMAIATKVFLWNVDHPDSQVHPKTEEYVEVMRLPIRDNWWYGTSVTRKDDRDFFAPGYNTFVSIEPILESFSDEKHAAYRQMVQPWAILGAETGNRKNKIVPKKEWITELVDYYSKFGYTKFFMKDSLRGLMGDDFRQEFPWKEKQ